MIDLNLEYYFTQRDEDSDTVKILIFLVCPTTVAFGFAEVVTRRNSVIEDHESPDGWKSYKWSCFAGTVLERSGVNVSAEKDRKGTS